jgi:hypothetical protein
LIRLSITTAAFEAIAATLPLLAAAEARIEKLRLSSQPRWLR